MVHLARKGFTRRFRVSALPVIRPGSPEMIAPRRETGTGLELSVHVNRGAAGG